MLALKKLPSLQGYFDKNHEVRIKDVSSIFQLYTCESMYIAVLLWCSYEYSFIH